MVADPILFLGFDQQIAPSEMLRYIELKTIAPEPSQCLMRLASEEEIAGQGVIQHLINQSPDGTWLALRPIDPLPNSFRFRLRLAPGAPSREGPLRTTVEQTFDFATHGPFEVVQKNLETNTLHSPETGWQILFSNPLNSQSVDRTQFKVEPEMPGLELALWEQTLVVSGWRRANTQYRLSLPDSLRDAYGQSLSGPKTMTFNVGNLEPRLLLSKRTSWTGETVIIQPASGNTLTIYSVSQKALNIATYAVRPEDWSQYQTVTRRAYSQDHVVGDLPGSCVGQIVEEIHDRNNELVETAIDLRQALNGTVGHAIVSIHVLDRERPEERPLIVWVQVTRIGLHAFVDGVLPGDDEDLSPGSNPIRDETRSLDGPLEEPESGGVCHRSGLGASGGHVLPAAASDPQHPPDSP